MSLDATLQPIGHNHAGPPKQFIWDEVDWGKQEDEAVFAPNDHLGNADIYNIVYPRLGPYPTPLYRRAVMLECLRCIAGDESDWDWREGRDITAGPETPDEMEAGAFQVSYDSRNLGADLQAFLTNKGITNATDFQARIKADPMLDMAYTARLLRDSTRWDGPLNRSWVTNQASRNAVLEFEELLS